jgi:hypothetical protein
MKHLHLALALFVSSACTQVENQRVTNPLESLPAQQHIWLENTEQASGGSESVTESSEGKLQLIPDSELSEELKQDRLNEILQDAELKKVSESWQTSKEAESSSADPFQVEQISFEDGTTENMSLYDSYETPGLTDACREVLALRTDEPIAVYRFDGRVISNVDMNITASASIITFNATARIRNVNLNLLNPYGKYCIDMEAGKAIRRVRISAPCHATVAGLTMDARRIRKVKVNLCAY